MNYAKVLPILGTYSAILLLEEYLFFEDLLFEDLLLADLVFNFLLSPSILGTSGKVRI